jgi:hypothetical protein
MIKGLAFMESETVDYVLDALKPARVVTTLLKYQIRLLKIHPATQHRALGKSGGL